jgi:hypothetical protein
MNNEIYIPSPLELVTMHYDTATLPPIPFCKDIHYVATIIQTVMDMLNRS